MASALHPWAIKIAHKLEHDPAWAKLLRDDPGSKKIKEIPSLSRRLRSYRLTDFQTIARHIRSGAIAIETFDDPSGPEAQYVWKGNILRINKAYCGDDPSAAHSHVVHEAVHAIQDDRRMFLSKPEAEQDAHFVHAVYCVEAKREHEVADYAAKGKDLARAFLAKGELDRRSEASNALQRAFYDDILAHYTNVDTTHSGDFAEKADALERERRRRDGIRGRR
jgi:hypothetical protein